MSHLSIHCPIVHWYSSPLKVISKHLAEEAKVRSAFKRKTRERFSALGRIKELKEAAEKIQKSDNSDIKENIQELPILRQENIDSHSATDEILDRNIYDPEPLVFAGDLVESKELEVGSKYIKSFGAKEEENKFKKEVVIAKPKVEPGEIQAFVTRTYDPQLHNLNLDQAANFEIYFPHNNVQRILDAIESERLKRLAKKHHLPEIIIKNFKFGIDKNDPRTVRQDANSLIQKCTEKKNIVEEAGLNEEVQMSQIEKILSQNLSVSDGSKEEKSGNSSSKKKMTCGMKKKKDREFFDEEKILRSDDDEDEKEKILPSEENLHKSHDAKENLPESEEILHKPSDEKGDEKLLNENIEEADISIRERFDDSREYCKKVFGSNYDELMRKFTEMLAESMKKANEDNGGKFQ